MKYLVFNFIFSLFYVTRYTSEGKINYNFKIVFNDTGVDLFEDVRFFLYTRINPETPQQLWIDDVKTITKSSFNASKAVKFMTHGWLNTYQGLNCKVVRKAFLEHDDYNVIVIDWGNVAKLNYLEAAARTKVVGRYIAKMISFLESRSCDASSMSLVGHSLGAHVVGLAGYQATNKIGHVVGLDPAAPGFALEDPANRISTEDASLVEIIHTNKDHYGISKPIGHTDFYPNGGGPGQPGCATEDVDCAHDRAYKFYAEAITRPKGLLAVRCENYETFLTGECETSEPISFPNWNGQIKKTVGLYFLSTADKAPFGLGINGTKPVKTTAE